MAVAICLAESDGDPLAKGTNGRSSSAPGSHDLGLAQVNDYFHADLLAKYDWRNPDQNLKMAYLIWHEALIERASRGGTGWEPWSTYNSNSYAKYLKRGEAAYRSLYRFTLTRYLMNHPQAKSKSELDHGQDVLQLQRAIGMAHGDQDGYFGKGTERALKAFQKRRNLEVDGVAGPAVCKRLGWNWLGPR
jgi:peptidoglycan hydrolase-like protein with peptidoglycan-binding domain